MKEKPRSVRIDYGIWKELKLASASEEVDVKDLIAAAWDAYSHRDVVPMSSAPTASGHPHGDEILATLADSLPRSPGLASYLATVTGLPVDWIEGLEQSGRKRKAR
jgi:hypothetical protein